MQKVTVNYCECGPFIDQDACPSCRTTVTQLSIKALITNLQTASALAEEIRDHKSSSERVKASTDGVRYEIRQIIEELKML